MSRRAGALVALVVVATTSVGCAQQPQGMTVGGEPCQRDLKVTPGSVAAGDRVTIRRDAGCDQDSAHVLTVRLGSASTPQRAVGTARLASDGSVAGTVLIPATTRAGDHYLVLDEETGCDDTASCAGAPVSVAVRVR